MDVRQIAVFGTMDIGTAPWTTITITPIAIVAAKAIPTIGLFRLVGNYRQQTRSTQMSLKLQDGTDGGHHISYGVILDRVVLQHAAHLAHTVIHATIGCMCESVMVNMEFLLVILAFLFDNVQLPQ